MDTDPVPRSDIIEELRRRKVLRSTTIYAVLAWCALQWSDMLFDQLGFPEWSLKLVLTMIVIGFPVVVALSWMFDLSPEGVRRSDPQALPARTRTSASRVLDAVILAVVIATVAMLLR